jgi:hypothetical protein
MGGMGGAGGGGAGGISVGIAYTGNKPVQTGGAFALGEGGMGGMGGGGVTEANGPAGIKGEFYEIK